MTKIICSGCGKKVAWDKTHTCVGLNGELEESILPWWVDTMKDQGDGNLETRTREPLHVPPCLFYLVVAVAVIAAVVYLWSW